MNVRQDALPLWYRLENGDTRWDGRVRQDALPLWYKLENWGALWESDRPDVSDQTLGGCKSGVFGLGVDKQPLDLLEDQRRLINNDLVDLVCL